MAARVKKSLAPGEELRSGDVDALLPTGRLS
jgi:hypothetical protein